MEDLIPLINSLQSVFKKTGMEEIKLPQIVVVGPQSSGKSSVLESLVKKSFLPRGTGIVTRCPIILQLNQLKDDLDAREWCRFSKTPEKHYTDFDEVRRAIEDLQVEMAGDKKGISMEPIILEVYSPNVIDLTVVDLPGIVKLAVEGQPFDIEQQVHDLLMKYISNESAIILAVSAANADIATSESIKLAQSVDPEGDRTLAVLTKLDLLDKGTDASSVLQGELIKVKLGIIGVVNRGQADINKNTSMEEALRKEEDILRKAYPHIPNIGSPYLALRLNQLLKEHIHKNLPDLIKRISKLTYNCQKELDLLGPKLSTNFQDCSWEIMKTTTKFVTKLNNTVRFRSLLFTDGDKVPFAVSVNEAFQQLRKDIAIDLVDLHYIHKALRNTLNFESYASIEEVFKHIVKEMLQEMESPAANCAKKVHDLLSSTTNICFTDTRLKNLNAMIQRVVDDLLESQLKSVLLGIKEYLEIQQGMISSSDEKFANLLANEPMKNEANDKVEKIKELEDKVSKLEIQLNIKKDLGIKAFKMNTEASLSEDEEVTANHVQALINAYLVVAKRELCDYIPKYIIYHLADQTMEKIMDAIKIATMGKEIALMSEPPEITFRRSRQLELLKNLQDADKIIKEIRITW